MRRFRWGERPGFGWKGALVSAVLFLAVVAAFLFGLHALDQTTAAEEKQSLEQALRRSTAYCYATEGFYPPGVEYLKEHYGITYDEERFLVDYRVEGSNLMPSITVIEKGQEG